MELKDIFDYRGTFGLCCERLGMNSELHEVAYGHVEWEFRFGYFGIS